VEESISDVVSELYDRKDWCEAEGNDLNAFNDSILGSRAPRKEMKVGGEDRGPDEVREEVGERPWLGDFHVNVPHLQVVVPLIHHIGREPHQHWPPPERKRQFHTPIRGENDLQ
jgi:hypothetical protein